MLGYYLESNEFKGECAKDKKIFPEKELELSHDIPKYLGGSDLDGRHWLCLKHHIDYDNLILKECLKFVGEDFKEEEKIEWMKELSRQSEELKIEFRKIANKVKEKFYELKKGEDDGDTKTVAE